MFFKKKFFTSIAPSEPLRSKKFQKALILDFEANIAMSHENETKIVKIKHSAHCIEEVYLDFLPSFGTSLNVVDILDILRDPPINVDWEFSSPEGGTRIYTRLSGILIKK